MPLSTSSPAEGAEPASTPARLSRRKFLRRAAAGAATAAAGTLLYTWRIEPHWVEIVRRTMPIAGLPEGLVGKRIVQVSDLHVGNVVDQPYLLACMERVAELKPDIIVVTGDFMTCHQNEQVTRALEVVRELPAASLGRFAIPGNHDYGDYWRQTYVVDQLTDELERFDVRMLRNDVADVDGLQVAGLDDLWGGNFRPEAALGQLDAARPAILLCHNPDGADHPQLASFRGWMLSGHTHGGQCKPPLMRPPVLPVKNKRYVAGEYELTGGGRLYINRGLGYIERLRFNARPEITAFTLERAEA
jgi:uncharacterized protein